jgi:hypothetical protein
LEYKKAQNLECRIMNHVNTNAKDVRKMRKRESGEVNRKQMDLEKEEDRI